MRRGRACKALRDLADGGQKQTDLVASTISRQVSRLAKRPHMAALYDRFISHESTPPNIIKGNCGWVHRGWLGAAR